MDTNKHEQKYNLESILREAKEAPKNEAGVPLE